MDHKPVPEDHKPVPDKIDAADVFHRIRIDEERKYKVENVEPDGDQVWDARDEQEDDKPMYDSRAGS